MDVVETVIETESDGAAMAVLRKRPAGGEACPLVVMFHDGPGIRGATHEFAVKLAAEGFDVVVPDLYHRQGRMLGWELHEREADPSIVDRLWELVHSLTDDGIQSDLDATLAAVGADHETPFATIGFCLGARAVARTMARLPERVVAGAMWHPSFLVDDTPGSPHRSADQLAAPLFIGIGADDDVQPLAGHREFLEVVEAKPEVDVELFVGAGHGYTWPGWPNYHQEAAERSFATTVVLFHRTLESRAH